MFLVGFSVSGWFDYTSAANSDRLYFMVLTHHLHPAVLADSLYIKTGLFLTENDDQRACCVGNQV